MPDERESMERQKAEYEQKLLGLQAFIKELNDAAKRHGTDAALLEADLTEAQHNSHYYESAIRDIEQALGGEKGDEKGRTTFWVFEDSAGEWRWNLRTSNNQIIADSGEGYKKKEDCLRGIEQVKDSADAPVKEKS